MSIFFWNVFNSFYCSVFFKFVVENQFFYIYANLIVKHSKFLNRMMYEFMTKTQQKFVIFENVNQITFFRFVKWLYYEYYHVVKSFHVIQTTMSQMSFQNVQIKVKLFQINDDQNLTMIENVMIISKSDSSIKSINNDWNEYAIIKNEKKKILHSSHQF